MSTIIANAIENVAGTTRFSVDQIGAALSPSASGIPFGSIMPIASNLAGSHTVPASGVVDSSGFMLCDGSAIPAGKTLSGSVPDLTNGRFLRGSTSAGSLGGSDSFTLAAANIPAHTHSTPNHAHTGSTGSAGAHTHTYSKSSGNGYPDGSADRGAYYHITQSTQNTGSAGSHSHTITVDSGGAGTTGSTGSTTAKAHIPKYVNVQYIIKVA